MFEKFETENFSENHPKILNYLRALNFLQKDTLKTWSFDLQDAQAMIALYVSSTKETRSPRAAALTSVLK
ncbi:MAG: hypothetical protein ACK5XB_18890 [Rhodospirillales bacterium]